MSTPTTTRPPTQRRPRKPLLPVAVRIDRLAYHSGLGMGSVDLIDEDGAETYLLIAHRDGGRVVGMRFAKMATGATHDINLTTRPWRCDCGDATYRPARPGGCKHVAALRLAAEQLRPAAPAKTTAAASEAAA
jgi:hypothetical protein